MSKKEFMMVLAIGTIAVPADAAVPPRIIGHWQIVSVAMVDAPVQALVHNDPSYMGRRLTFTSQRLAWDSPKNSSETACVQPRIDAVPNDRDPANRTLVRGIGGPAIRSFSVRCADGKSWGPTLPLNPALLTLRDGTLAMWWYDNGLLKLHRIK